MSDKEIIKALKCCSHRNGDLPCEGCPAYSIAQMCMEDLMSDAIDLITHQKAEIERLEKELMKCKLEKEMMYQTVKEIKSEATKEFAERLKEGELYMRINFPNTKNGIEDYIVLSDDIDNLVKEMTEIATNQRKEDEGK